MSLVVSGDASSIIIALPFLWISDDGQRADWRDPSSALCLEPIVNFRLFLEGDITCLTELDVDEAPFPYEAMFASFKAVSPLASPVYLDR